MKYSIRTKIILLIFVAITFLSCILGGFSMYFTSKMTDEYAYENVTLICERTAADINAMFAPLEKAVDYMSINAMEDISNPMNLTDEIYYQNYIDKMQSILSNTSNNIDSAIAVYLRLNPDICGPTAGIFMTRDSSDVAMHNSPVTDLSAYDKNDTEYVGWYYEPIAAKRPIWMMPYYNKNINVYMISYVIPLLKDGSLVGVLGMDINFDYITEQVKNIKVFKSGYAYITNSDGKVIYHPNMEYGQQVVPNEGWWKSECNLNNGMILNITAPLDEINASHNTLIFNLIFSTLSIMMIFIIVTILITNKMITPLQKLNHIAKEISGGNYDVDFDFKRPNDEIGQLTASFQNTVGTLKEYMSYMSILAYKDQLTSVRNRTAYEEQINLIEESLLKDDSLSLAIAVFDVNNLKYINDNLGHEKGDELLKGACRIICHIFSHSAVFRIGGDEFVAVIKNQDTKKIEQLFEAFDAEMKESWTDKNLEKRISVAYGYSQYNNDIDEKKIEPAFKRADAMMYNKKKEMKKNNII